MKSNLAKLAIGEVIVVEPRSYSTASKILFRKISDETDKYWICSNGERYRKKDGALHGSGSSYSGFDYGRPATEEEKEIFLAYLKNWKTNKKIAEEISSLLGKLTPSTMTAYRAYGEHPEKWQAVLDSMKELINDPQ